MFYQLGFLTLGTLNLYAHGPKPVYSRDNLEPGIMLGPQAKSSLTHTATQLGLATLTLNPNPNPSITLT